MLSGNFFDIQSITFDECEVAQQKCTVVVSLNANHPVYLGHFPGNPVVPGVCQIQMVKEIIETIVKYPVRLREADNIKFLSMINPQVNSQLEFHIHIKPANDQLLSATATIGYGKFVFLKFKGKFEPTG